MNDRLFKPSQAHKLEDPERLKWLPPAEVLSRLHLSVGMRVADIGAGRGYFAIPIAKAVGDSGHVFAIDLQPEMLEMLRQKLEAADIPPNISLHQGAASALPLPNASVDLALYANVWHEIDDRDAALGEARRITRPNGSIAILDWRSDKTPPPGPPQDHRIAAESLVSFLQDHRCRMVSCYNVGSYSYLITAKLGLQ